VNHIYQVEYLSYANAGQATGITENELIISEKCEYTSEMNALNEYFKFFYTSMLTHTGMQLGITM